MRDSSLLSPFKVSVEDLLGHVRQCFQEHQVPIAFSVSAREVEAGLMRSAGLRSPGSGSGAGS